MYSDFQELLKKRQYETIAFIQGVKIIQRRKTEYNCLIEDALDQFYVERLLEEGDCIICQTKTSKFCSNCGTHYCSSDCQKKDWPNHVSTCMRPSSPSPSSLDFDVEDNSELVKSKFSVGGSRDSSVMEREKNSNIHTDNIKHNMKRHSTENTTVNKTKSYEKKKLQYTWRKNGSKNTNRESNIEGMSKSYKSYEKGVENKSLKVNDMRTHQRKFTTLGEMLRVKCIKNQGSICWVIKDSDLNELEHMEKILSVEANGYPLVEDVKDDFLYAMLYNHKWHRCKLFSNANGKKLARCVDYGMIFAPKQLKCRQLPDHIREIKEMALKFEFINSTAPDENSFIDVKLISAGMKGVYQVEICGDEKNEVSKVKRNRIRKHNKNQVSKNNKNEIVKNKTPKEENFLLQRSIVEGLKLSSEGLFIVGKADGEKLVGCIIPDGNNEALVCCNRMKNICQSDIIATDAKISDLVMVIGSDNIARRGIVKNRLKDKYTVHLIDYGFTVEAGEVYKLPEEVVNLIKLECSVIESEFLPGAHQQFDVNKTYRFKVVKKSGDGQWKCEFSHELMNTNFAYGIIQSMSWNEAINYVKFKNKCKVSISYVGKRNDIFVIQNQEMWRERINVINFDLNNTTDLSDVDLGSLSVGDLVLGKYRTDGKWYRAKVTSTCEELIGKCEVLFIDYGNYQICDASELRVLPKKAKYLPIFVKKVILFGPDDSFSSKGRDYLEKLAREAREFIMTYRDSDSSEEVTLTDNDGTNVNTLAYWKAEEEDILDPVTGKYLDNKGIPELSSNLVVLSVSEKEFLESGVFWAVHEENENFKNMNNISHLMNMYFESNHEVFVPKEGEPCIVNIAGEWYRAQAMVVFDAFVRAFLVDSGRSQLVMKPMIRGMVPEFLKVPAVASKCVLNDFDKYTIEELEHFYSILISNIDISLKEKAVVKKVVENTHYVELLPDLYKI